MRIIRTLIPLSLALIISLTACQEEPQRPVGPEVTADHVEENPIATVVDIGPSGGQVNGYNGSFIVPSGALSSTVSISMSYNAASPTEAVMGPAGQQFAVACDLILDKPSGYDPTDEFEIQLWDEDEEEWISLGGTSLGPAVKVSISHFSKYRIVNTSA